jgi:hypothetical protein
LLGELLSLLLFALAFDRLRSRSRRVFGDLVACGELFRSLVLDLCAATAAVLDPFLLLSRLSSSFRLRLRLRLLASLFDLLRLLLMLPPLGDLELLLGLLLKLALALVRPRRELCLIVVDEDAVMVPAVSRFLSTSLDESCLPRYLLAESTTEDATITARLDGLLLLALLLLVVLVVAAAVVVVVLADLLRFDEDNGESLALTVAAELIPAVFLFFLEDDDAEFSLESKNFVEEEV